ncbi:uncharacterized protein LOC110103672 [Dendrobium catenatum]|uniref:Molybdenum cofactor sulfurase n=1 Tax=Dendrobium catenatum TaxID=906689 RepID=A0A2I0VSB3_9ASPA|nr:uncharacterized protein LOC110103672 [Dendrobium catenatum]PKU66296.1 Molybdenum cofactor sulfurase [Dendrobium catenatum]
MNHLSLLNPITHCAFLILDKKNSRRSRAVSDKSRKKQTPGEILKGNSEEYKVHFFESANFIPEPDERSYEFITMYPAYQSSNQIDQLRSNEYFHLNEPEAKVCLDYCGFGLFSYLQSFQLPESSAFCLSAITSNLSNHALYGSAVEGTAENDIKTRIMDYLKTPENEYSLVFTASRGAAFQLLAEYYPFKTNRRLLTMFDHESQSVNWMVERAKDKGGKVYSAKFMWPSLKVCSSEIIKLLSSKKRRKNGSATGLLVFPVQSRVSGVKYSYKWMALAKQYGWHVLLDAGSLGPKDMESFGLSIFRPDFIITSFYRVFGSDPTGFGCLLIKKSVLSCLKNRSNESVLGIVRILSVFPQYLSEFADGEAEEDGVNVNEETMVADTNQGLQMPVFASLYIAPQDRDLKENEIDGDKNSATHEASNIIEETDSIGEIMKSPIFSDDESCDSSLWIYLGQSPSGSENSVQHKNGKLVSQLPVSWFSGEKNHKRLETKVLLNNSHNMSDDHVLSFDKSVLSVSEDENQIKKDPKEYPHSSVIQEEIVQEAIEPQFVQSSSADGVKANSSISAFSHHKFHENDSRSEICKENVEQTYKSAIRRETEFEFILLDRKEENRYKVDLNVEPGVALTLDDDRPSQSLTHYLDPEDDVRQDDSDYEDDEEFKRKEPEIVCRHIDHINMIGINKTALRIQYLVNWLVGSLLHLRLPGSYGEHGVPLVCVYGPKINNKRGATVAFNVRDRSGGLIHPETVQKLAERNGIRLGVGFLSNIRFSSHEKAVGTSLCNFISNGCHESKDSTFKLEVVTASLGFLTNFADVYKLWAFVAEFLDPSFIEMSDT